MIAVDKIRSEHTHESRQHHQINLVGIDYLCQCRIKICAQRMRAMINDGRGYALLLRRL